MRIEGVLLDRMNGSEVFGRFEYSALFMFTLHCLRGVVCMLGVKVVWSMEGRCGCDVATVWL